MQNKYYLRPFELAFIVLNLSTYKIFTGYAKIFSDISGPSAPITALFSGVIVWLIIYGLLTAYEKNGNKTLPDLLKNPGKTLLFLILTLYLLFSSAATLRLTGELLKAVSFPTAPLSFIFLIIVAGAVICCAQGFDAIGRIHSIIIPAALLLSVAVLVFAFPHGKVSNLFPLLGYGGGNTFINGLASTGLYGDLIVLFMLSPFAESGVNFKKTSLISLGAGIIINTLVVTAFTMLTPYTVSDSVAHPFLQLVKLFSAGRFFQRIDGYFMYVTSGCGILSLALNFFIITYGAKQAFNLPKIRPLSYPLGVLVTFAALLLTNRESADFIAKNGLWMSSVAIFAVFGCIILFSAFKARRNQ